jgi:hypothetical protein
MSSEEQVKALQKEVAMLREVLAKCLKARQVNHIKQIIKETLYGRTS